MPAFDRLLSTDILGDAWKQILTRFSEGRLGQLMTLKPIEVYNAVLPYELDGAKLEVELKAYVENVLQKRFKNAVSILSLDFSGLGSDVLNYNCHVSVKVSMDYDNMGQYLTDQFANRPYELFDGRVELTLQRFRAWYDGRLLAVEIPLSVVARHKKFSYSGDATILAKGKIRFQPSTHVVSVIDISYTLSQSSRALRVVNLLYYQQIIAALEDFLQFSIRGELDEGLALAKAKIADYEKEVAFVSGEIDSLELERIELNADTGSGVFLAEGRIKLMQ